MFHNQFSVMIASKMLTSLSIKWNLNNRLFHSVLRRIQPEILLINNNKRFSVTSRHSLKFHTYLSRHFTHFPIKITKPTQKYERRQFSENSAVCWKCSKHDSETTTTSGEIFFCKHCGSIRTINTNYDYFTLLGQDNKFSIDAVDLTKKFRQLQSVLHPDKFSNKSEYEQALSADWSSLLNKSYKTLLIPIDRAIYMLQQHNITIPEENTAVDKEFLFEMMERNEEVENANSVQELDELLVKVKTDLNDVISTLNTSISNSDLTEAKAKVITMKYLISLEASIKMKCSKLIEQM